MKRILLLEDDRALNRGISLKLEKEGYEVLSAFSVKEAEEQFQKGKLDLIISDITLPDGNGMDFCREVRKRSDVYIIFLTALDQEVDIVNGYDCGADDYINKALQPSGADFQSKCMYAKNREAEWTDFDFRRFGGTLSYYAGIQKQRCHCVE
ncbi:response regulator [Blautia argi]|uniref:response regulator n=1 Tax=Blautia argi TaxID=1912897 RepID=UPI0026A3ED13|nr:response regulator [Blautia argi]